MPENDDTTTKPAQGTKARKHETLHVSYLRSANSGGVVLVDAVVFGTELDAYRHANSQDPKWDVVQLRKGQSLAEAIQS